MFCQNCGKEIDDNAVVCVHCGVAVNKQANPMDNPEYQTAKTGMGILLALLLGVIGLVIGILLYPTGTYARSSFIKAWGITFGISIGVSILLSVFYVIFVFAILGSFNGLLGSMLYY